MLQTRRRNSIVFAIAVTFALPALGETDREGRLGVVESESDEGPSILLEVFAEDPTRGLVGVLAHLSALSSNFTEEDVTLTNATFFRFEGTGMFYRFGFQAIADGQFGCVVNAGTFTDVDGNPNTTSNTITRLADFMPPTIELSSGAGDPVNGPILVAATLSEASTDFTSADLSATNASVSEFSGSEASYTFTLAPAASGSFSAVALAGVFTDALGNPNIVSNTLTRTADCLHKGIFESEWIAIAADLELYEDASETPGRRLPERWGLAMVSTVLCQSEHPWHDRTLQVFTDNLVALQAEPDAVHARAEPFQNILAALLLVNQSRQKHFMSLLGLTNEYWTVRNQSRDPSDGPLSEGGDLDGDGFSNLAEYDNVIASGGTMEDFAEAASDPGIRGMIGMPSASWLVLVLSALAIAFAVGRKGYAGPL